MFLSITFPTCCIIATGKKSQDSRTNSLWPMLYFLPSTLELCCLQHDWHPKPKGLGVLKKTDPEHEGVSEPCCFPQENSTRTDVVHRPERAPKKTFHVVLQTPWLGNTQTEIEDAPRLSRSLEVTLGHSNTFIHRSLMFKAQVQFRIHTYSFVKSTLSQPLKQSKPLHLWVPSTAWRNFGSIKLTHLN